MSDAASVFSQLAQNETALQQHDQSTQGNAEQVFGNLAQGATPKPPQGPTIGPTPKASDIPTFGYAYQSPQERLTMPLAKGLIMLHDKLREIENFNQEGRQEHPIQAQVGDLANKIEGLFVGNPQHPEAGIGTGKEGLLTNPVTAAILPGEGAEPAIASTAKGITGAVKGGISAIRGAKAATTAGEAAEEAPGLIKQVVKGEKVAQPALQSAMRGAATAAAEDTGVTAGQSQGIRGLLDDTIAKAATKERGLYDTLNKAAGADMKDLYDRQEELLEALDDPTNVHNRKALADELSVTQKAIKVHEDEARLNGVDPGSIKQATASTQQRYSLQDLKAKLFNNESIVQGNVEHGAEESINVDSAIRAAENLNKPSRFAPEGSPTRLQQALGKNGASKLLDNLYAAQKQGQTALKRQQLAKWIGGAIGVGATAEGIKAVAGSVH